MKVLEKRPPVAVRKPFQQRCECGALLLVEPLDVKVESGTQYNEKWTHRYNPKPPDDDGGGSGGGGDDGGDGDDGGGGGGGGGGGPTPN